MQSIAEAIYQSAPSLFLQQGQAWLIPTIQSIHILAIAVVLAAVLMTNLRVLGLAGTAQDLAWTTGRYMPWVWWGLLVLLASGLLLILLEPVRALVNVSFWLKMGLLVVAILATLTFERAARRDPAAWSSGGRRRGIVAFVLASFAVWCAIVFAGRWIGYS